MTLPEFTAPFKGVRPLVCKGLFSINWLAGQRGFDFFVNHWANAYKYELEHLYVKHMPMKQPRYECLLDLFTWKNGTKLSARKQFAVIEKYTPLNPESYVFDANRYLTAKHSGGPVWNIFFCHINEPQTYPLFDQHVARALRWILHDYDDSEQTTIVLEPHKDLSKAEIYDEYLNWYKPNLEKLIEQYPTFKTEYGNRAIMMREVDKALFTFGRFLKTLAEFG